MKIFNINKKRFMSYIKDYFKKVIAYLKNWKEAQVEGYKKFGDFEFHSKANGWNNKDEKIRNAFIFYLEDDTTKGPMFYFFKDGLEEGVRLNIRNIFLSNNIVLKEL